MQLPFTSVNYGTCTLTEGRLVTRALLEKLKEGIKVYGKEEYPWIKYLVENRWPDGKWFLSNQKNYKQPNEYRGDQAPYWAYMTAKAWPESVSNIEKSLRDQLNRA